MQFRYKQINYSSSLTFLSIANIDVSLSLRNSNGHSGKVRSIIGTLSYDDDDDWCCSCVSESVFGGGRKNCKRCLTRFNAESAKKKKMKRLTFFTSFTQNIEPSNN